MLKEKLLKEKLEWELLLKKSNKSSSSVSTGNSNSITPTNSPSKKRRKLNPSTSKTSNLDGNDHSTTYNNKSTNNVTENNNNTQNANRKKIHGLPTYGIKMSAREVRAIQRHFDNTYIAVWKGMARKDSNRILSLYQQIQSIRPTNFKKTSSLWAREAKRWQTRNFKQVKDLQTKARRDIRGMSNFWKRNEREKCEIEKRAEKITLE